MSAALTWIGQQIQSKLVALASEIATIWKFIMDPKDDVLEKKGETPFFKRATFGGVGGAMGLSLSAPSSHKFMAAGYGRWASSRV